MWLILRSKLFIEYGLSIQTVEIPYSLVSVATNTHEIPSMFYSYTLAAPARPILLKMKYLVVAYYMI